LHSPHARTETWQARYLARYYNPERGWIGGTTEFHTLCARAIAPGSAVLEVGAGLANSTTRYLATLGAVHGLDVDPAVRENPCLTTATVFDGGRFPFASGSFDHAVSNYVVEHLSDPEDHLRELHRVVRPGGRYVFRTPNRWHYVTLAGALLPHRAHRMLANRLRALPADAHDPYPTVYRMNTAWAIRRAAARNGWAVESLRHVEKEPSYGLASRALFVVMTAYERVVNATDRLAAIRANLFVVLRRLP
jgi:SAM-dependent methyltransferase